jgi:regulatory protein
MARFHPTSKARAAKPQGPPPSAYALALRWLAVRDRAEGELRLKLRRAGVDPAAIDTAIERVRGLGYLDDARFARGRAESLIRSGRLGPRAVSQRLIAAGVSRDTVRLAVDGAMQSQDEAALARDAVRKRHPAALGSDDPKLRARAARFLLGRGFSPAVVGKVLACSVDPDEG